MNTDPTLTPLVHNLLELLREELEHYGDMLGRLDRQQECVMKRAADDVLESVASVNAQMLAIQSVRERREARQSEVARAVRQPDAPRFADLIPLLPEALRGAVQTLVKENNRLLQRVQQRARQNHLLLMRSLEQMQRLLAAFTPAGPAIYNETGRVPNGATLTQQLYQAVG